MVGEVATVDVANHELFAALRKPGCPACRVVARSEHRGVASFTSEGHLDEGVRRHFVEAGGFCPRHAWALHAESQRIGTGAVIADAYGLLADRDLAWLAEAQELASGRRGRQQLASRVRRSASCYQCAQVARVQRRQAFFLLQLLADARARDRYRDSDGLCFVHLRSAIEMSFEERGLSGIASFLLDDWHRRLDELRTRLAEYDRKRDYRHADRRTPAEQSAWTEIVRRYVGDPNPARRATERESVGGERDARRP